MSNIIFEFNDRLVKTRQTFHEFVEMANEMAPLNPQGESMRTMSCPNSFMGDALSFPDMVERCYDGYNAKDISAKRIEIGGLVDVEANRDTLKHCGEALDVPTYLSGDMRCWWAEDTDKATPKRIHITFSANCTADVNAEMFYNHGGAIAVLCDALDSAGASTKITCTFTNTDVLGGSALQVIELKDYNEAIDIPRIGATTHPSFFRRIGFKYFESLGTHLKMPSLSGGHGCSRTGANRGAVVSDTEFADWLRISEDEIVIDLPAADISVFKDTKTAANWVTNALETINGSSSQHIKIHR